MGDLGGGEAKAQNHPLIQEFVGLVNETTDTGILQFSDITEKPFMKFWKNFIIHKYEPDVQDFRTVFYGSHIVELYQRDCTGLLLSEMGFSDAFEMVLNLNKKVIDTRQWLYASNSLFWKDEEHKVAHQVKIPLQRGDAVNEVLVCMTFD